MKKIKYLILPFLAFLGAVSVKAYDFTSYRTSPSTYFGLWQNTTRLSQIECTSAAASCLYDNYSLPDSSNTYNNILFVLTDNSNTTYEVGGSYHVTMFFYQDPVDYLIGFTEIQDVTGVSYRSMSTWTSDSLVITNFSMSRYETNLYKIDVWFVVSTSNIAGFSFRFYTGSNTISNSNEFSVIMTRYYQVVQTQPGSIDYTDQLDDLNQNITDSTQDIINNQNVNTEAIIKSNMTCNYNLFNNSNWEWGSLSSSTGGNTDNNNHKYMRTKDFITVKPNITYNFSIKSGYRFQLVVYYSDGTFSSSQNVYNSFTFTTPSNISQIKFYWRTTGTATDITESVSALNIFVGSEDDCVNKIDNINDSINNSDTSEANSSAASFFNNFNTSNNGGISGIITAPLTAINRMLDNQCSPLSFTYRDQTVSFPCGTDTWNQLSEIRTFLNLTEGGALCYLILRKLFLLIDNLKNPDSDKVEVMSL